MASRARKYDHITSTLPKASIVEPERRDLVNAVKAEIVAPPSVSDPPMESNELYNAIVTMNHIIERVLQHEKRSTAGKRYASEFGRAYADVRKLKDKLRDWTASLQVLLDAYEELMIEQFEVEGVTSLNITNVGNIVTYPVPRVSVKDREAYRVWCIKQGLERDMHIHAKKTESLVKELLLAGEPSPPGLEVTAGTQVTLTRA